MLSNFIYNDRQPRGQKIKTRNPKKEKDLKLKKNSQTTAGKSHNLHLISLIISLTVPNMVDERSGTVTTEQRSSSKRVER